MRIRSYHRLMATSIAIAAVISGCQSIRADWKSLEDASEDIRVRLGTSAISVAVFDDSGILEQVTLGTQSVESTRLVPEDAAWHIGSCTKAMTAVLIGRLVDDGLLSFKTTIGEIFSGESIHANFVSVTIEELLRHHGGTTGSIYQTHSVEWEAMWRGFTDSPRKVRRSTVVTILSDPPSQPVGSYSYSNFGFLVAAAMAEEITDVSWQELMRREVFDPLEMRTAGFGAPTGDSAWPHRWDVSQNIAVNPVEPVADNPPSLGPAGTVHASMADWIRFLDVFIGGGPVGYLNQAVLDDLVSPLTKSKRGSGANPDTAAGWFVVDRGWAGGDALNHAGSNTMNYALVWLAPAKRRGIAIATNGARPETAQILDGLAAWLVTRYISTID